MIEPIEMLFSDLSSKAQGLRIVHISDTHVSRARAAKRMSLDKLSSRKIDLLLFTGDYMMRLGPTQPGLDWLNEATRTLKPRLGCYGIFGNHDTPEFRQEAAKLPIHWLDGNPAIVQDAGLMIAGASTPCGSFEGHCDMTPLIQEIGKARLDGTLTPQTLTIVLSHVPSASAFIEGLGVDWVLSGHTHGGQIRTPNGWSPLSLGMPTHYNAGLFRLRNTQLTVSRGMGGRPYVPRIFCPPQVPVYTLRRGPSPGTHGHGLNLIRAW